MSNIVLLYLTSMIFVAGMMSRFFPFPTFRGKQTRDVGCTSLYFFTTAILSMIIVVILTLKFAFLGIEYRTWCVTNYSAFVQIFDWIINNFHFTFTFVINGISTLIVIITITRTRFSAQKTKTIQRTSTHFSIDSCSLSIVSFSDLICMESTKLSCLYLIGF